MLESITQRKLKLLKSSAQEKLKRLHRKRFTEFAVCYLKILFDVTYTTFLKLPKAVTPKAKIEFTL